MKHYLAIFTLVAALSSAGILTLNIVVDPFGVWRPESKPLSAVVIGSVGYSRMAKNHWIRHRQPDLVMLGNSHAASAFQADHFQRYLDKRSPFNMALVGASMDEMLVNMRHAYFATGVRSFLVTVDLLSFGTSAPNAKPLGDFAVASDHSPGSRFYYLRDLALTSFSPEATARSLLILHRGYVETHTASGFVSGCKADPRGSRQAQLINSAVFRRNQFLSRPEQWRGSHDRQIQALNAMIGFAVEHDIELLFLVPPFHVSYYYALEAAGLWEVHKTILRALVAGIEASGRGTTMPVLDFTGFNAFTAAMTEDGNVAVDFWLDADHFNCALAEHMVRRIAILTTGDGSTATDPTPGFGYRLTRENLARHLRGLDNEIAAWQAQNPAAHAILSGRLRATNRPRPADYPGGP